MHLFLLLSSAILEGSQQDFSFENSSAFVFPPGSRLLLVKEGRVLAISEQSAGEKGWSMRPELSIPREVQTHRKATQVLTVLKMLPSGLKVAEGETNALTASCFSGVLGKFKADFSTQDQVLSVIIKTEIGMTEPQATQGWQLPETERSKDWMPLL